MTAHRRFGAAVIVGLLLAVLPISTARADQVVKRYEHSTDVYCETSTEGLVVSAGVNRSVSAEGVQTYAFAAVFNAGGTVDAYGETSDIVFAYGTIAATVEIADHQGVVSGKAHLVGTYTIDESTTMRGRPLKLLGNQYMVQTTTIAPVHVDWQTLEVAGVVLVADGTTVVDPNCDGYDMIREDIITAPHRLSFKAEEYVLSGSCSAGPLTEILIVPSEGGLSLLFFGPDGLVGDTNLDVTDTGPQLVQWWLPDAEEPVNAEITVAFDEAGTPYTTVVIDKGHTIRTTTQPLLMSFTVGLPDGSTVSGSCARPHQPAHRGRAGGLRSSGVTGAR